MGRKEINIGLIIKIFTLVLIISVAGKIIINYYNKVLNEKDRLEAKRIQTTVSLVLAKYVNANVTYRDKPGRIFWTKQNADIIKNGVIANIFAEDGKFPCPGEKGYYYYMYLEEPYTVIKLPYREKGEIYIDTNVVTQEYIRKEYPKDEYVQVNEEVPYLETDYDEEYYYELELKKYRKNSVVCLNA